MTGISKRWMVATPMGGEVTRRYYRLDLVEIGKSGKRLECNVGGIFFAPARGVWQVFYDLQWGAQSATLKHIGSLSDCENLIAEWNRSQAQCYELAIAK